MDTLSFGERELGGHARQTPAVLLVERAAYSEDEANTKSLSER